MEKLILDLAEVKSSQEFISSRYIKSKDDYSQLLDINKKLETEIKNLKSEAIELRSQGTKEAIKLDTRIYLAILAKLLKLQRFDSINYLPSVRE